MSQYGANFTGINQTSWCSNCTSCRINPCDDGGPECVNSGLGQALLFILIFVAVGITVICFLFCRCCCNNAHGSLAWKRVPTAVMLATTFCATIASILFDLYLSESFSASPPCTKDAFPIGLAYSGAKREDVTLALSTCPTELRALEAGRYLSIIALLAITVGGFASALVTPRWFWIVIPSGIATFAQLITLIIVAALFTGSNFCGTGQSLQSLGFSTKFALDAMIYSLVVTASFGILIPIVGAWQNQCEPTDPSQTSEGPPQI